MSIGSYILDSHLDSMKQTLLYIKDQAFLLTVSVQGNTLRVSLEEQKLLQRWSRSFAAAYINDLTAKAGSQRKFPIFCQMLFTAMDCGRRSDNLKLDVKTPQELMEATRQNTTLYYAEQAGRLFLIVAYKAEFEAIFYPLTLDKIQYDLNNDNEAYLLQAYQASKNEIYRLQMIETDRQYSQFCQSCNNYISQIAYLEYKLEEAEHKYLEAVKIANMAVQSRDKYKDKLLAQKTEIQQIIEYNKQLLEDNRKMYAKIYKLHGSALSSRASYQKALKASNSRTSSRNQSVYSSRASSTQGSRAGSRASSRSSSPRPDFERPTRSQLLQQQQREKLRREYEKREKRYFNGGRERDAARSHDRRSIDKMEMLKNVNQTIEELKQLVGK